MITLKNITKDYGHGPVLQDVSCTINPKEFACIVGPSGAGKSTLLSIIIGAEDPTSGTLSIDGMDVRGIPEQALRIFRRKIGIVYQDGKLIRNRTVYENIAFPLEVCGADDDLIDQRVGHILDALKLRDRMDALPQELSGGEKARVAIGRAIAHQPVILLADEPTQNLDPAQAAEVLQIFFNINKAGTTVLMATHDPTAAENAPCRVLRLEKGVLVTDTGAKKLRTDTPPKPAEQTEKVRIAAQ